MIRRLMVEALCLLALAAPAYAQVDTHTGGPLNYLEIPASATCTSNNPCGLITYLSWMGAKDWQVKQDIETFFNADWRARNPGYTVIAPLLPDMNDKEGNWGSQISTPTQGLTGAAGIVRAIQSSGVYDPRLSLLTGGSAGGGGTLAGAEFYGPKGLSGLTAWTSFLSFDGMIDDQTARAQARGAMCGTPITAVHGGNDQNINPARDVKDVLAGCPNFTYIEIAGAGHGTWNQGLSDPVLLDHALATMAANAAPADALDWQRAQLNAAARAPLALPSNAKVDANYSPNYSSQPRDRNVVPQPAVNTPQITQQNLTPSVAPTASMVCDALPAVPHLLPCGMFHTAGARVLDQNNEDVRFACIAFWDADPKKLAVALLAGFNCIRFPWTDISIDHDLETARDLVDRAYKLGLRVIFDHHTNQGLDGECGAQQQNGIPFDKGPGTDGTDGCGRTGTVTADDYVRNWVKMISPFSGHPGVIGADLHNEPLFYGRGGGATWGDNGVRDLRALFERVGTALRAIKPDLTLIAACPFSLDALEGNCNPVRNAPIRLPNVVYTVHEYPNNATYPSNRYPGLDHYKDQMTYAWGWMVIEDYRPVWIGEYAVNGKSSEEAWKPVVISYIEGCGPGDLCVKAPRQPPGWSYWMMFCLPQSEPIGFIKCDGTPHEDQAALAVNFIMHARAATITANTQAYGALLANFARESGIGTGATPQEAAQVTAVTQAAAQPPPVLPDPLPNPEADDTAARAAQTVRQRIQDGLRRSLGQ